ncbi:unnamed protein product, partial [Rotaria sp. Silwood1]
MTIPPTLREVL